MFKDGKIFGKINVIDFMFTILVLILIIFATFKFSKFENKSNDTSAEQNIEYKMLIKGVRNYTVDAFRVGDAIYDNQSKVFIGTIKNIEANPTKEYRELINGEVKSIENPYRFDIVFTIESSGVVTNEAYYANKSIELKVNSAKVIETKYAKTTGTIFEIVTK